MYIINESYFNQEIIRPDNGSNLYATSGSENNSFEAWIDKYARLCLQNALGNVLFADFDQYVNDNGDLESAPTKWNNLVDGITYNYNNKPYTWKGLKIEEGKNKESLLADYVFSQWYMLTQLSQLSGMGESAGKSINASVVSGNTRYYKVWNEFVRAYQGKNKYYKDYRFYWDNVFNRSLYNDVLLNRYSINENENGYVSLIDFLTQNETDYTDASKRLYKLQNFAGI